MRLAFFGTSVFAVPILRALAPSVVLVVTQPDRPSGRGLKLEPTPVKTAAEALGLAVTSPSKIRTPEFHAELVNLEADAFVVAAYGRILPSTILETPRLGCLNLHGSILPAYRGAAPIQRCIQDGCRVTGVTLMQMDEGMDTGDILAVAELKIGADEVYGDLQDRLASLAAELAAAWVPRIVAGRAHPVRQWEGGASHAAKVEKSEAELAFTMTAAEAYNRFRAFTPSPGATIRTQHGLLRISEARLALDSGEPGTVLALKPHLRVAFGSGALDLLAVRPEGRKAMPGSDWANGIRIRVGDMLQPAIV